MNKHLPGQKKQHDFQKKKKGKCFDTHKRAWITNAIKVNDRLLNTIKSKKLR